MPPRSRHRCHHAPPLSSCSTAVASHQAVIIVLPGAVGGAVSCRICCWKSGGEAFFQMANNCKQRRSFSDPQGLKDDGDNDYFFHWSSSLL
ncbi:uncharacterized protein DS421_18g629810 [Arachis hypogaea]|nr:uncharacterized protein DS421_18g629810 [Arachis hypogaea]